MRTPTARSHGIGLVELLVVMTMFTIIGYVSFITLNMGVNSWKNVMGTEEASLELAKAFNDLDTDIRLTSFDELGTRRVPGAGPNRLPSNTRDGGVVWFLSPIDPVTGSMVRDDEDQPYWQRNIVYYLAHPGEHQATFGNVCQGGPGPFDSLDDRCPHKVLIRKVVDDRNPTSSDLSSQIEQKMSSDRVRNRYLTRPLGYDVSAMTTEVKLEEVKVVARNILSFHVEKAPDPNFPEEVVITIQSLALKDAGKSINVGTDPLSGSQYTSTRKFSVFPQNTQP